MIFYVFYSNFSLRDSLENAVSENLEFFYKTLPVATSGEREGVAFRAFHIFPKKMLATRIF